MTDTRQVGPLSPRGPTGSIDACHLPEARLHCLSYPGAYELPAPPKAATPVRLGLRTVDDRHTQAHFVRVRPISDRGPPRRLGDGSGVLEMRRG
jgi:hypothetical protein